MMHVTVETTDRLVRTIAAFFNAALEGGPEHSTTIIQLNYRDALTLDELDERGRTRLAHCGRYYSSVSPYDGHRQTGRFWCGMFRLCSVCADRRAEQHRHWMELALLEGEVVYWGRVTTPQRRQLTRSLDKTQYRAYPVAAAVHGDDTEYSELFTRPLEAKASQLSPQPVTQAFIERFPWEAVLQTPPHRCISGRLGEMVAAATGEETEERRTARVTVQHFVTSANPAQELAAMAQAVDETKTLNPHTEIELQQALIVRQDAYRQALRRLGVTSVYSYNKILTVDLHRVVWSGPPETPVPQDWAQILSV